MSEKKPKNIEEYKKWLRENHEVDMSNRTSTYYDSVTNRMKTDLESSELWTDLGRNLEEYNDEYRLKTGYPLTAQSELEVFVKPFDSFLLKTYRKNVLENRSWPNEPPDGWILPSNWFSRINDVLRTLVVVKYLDGVEFNQTE